LRSDIVRSRPRGCAERRDAALQRAYGCIPTDKAANPTPRRPDAMVEPVNLGLVSDAQRAR
jgi:hypothetical protein